MEAIQQAKINEYRLTHYQYPRKRVIGDSQVRSDTHHMFTLELIDSLGNVGLGFGGSVVIQLPPLAEIERVFREEVAPGVIGKSPFELTLRQSRPRGGNIRGSIFGQAINQALWDLQGKQTGLPLYKLLGGTRDRVRAYASGLDFHLSTQEMTDLFGNAAQQGFGAFKVKVGHPDLQWDLDRLRAVVETVGSNAILMVDANEAWSPKEAIRRAFAYRDAGFNIYWIEDPCLRDDYEGLARVAQAVPFTHINTGEYLDLRGKQKLMEARAVDILNVHGDITGVLKAGWLAVEYGIPVSLGNTALELGVHLAAALPEAHWMEYSFQDYNHMVEQPIVFKDGYAYAPDRPGHGLVLSEAARQEYARPDTM